MRENDGTNVIDLLTMIVAIDRMTMTVIDNMITTAIDRVTTIVIDRMTTEESEIAIATVIATAIEVAMMIRIMIAIQMRIVIANVVMTIMMRYSSFSVQNFVNDEHIISCVSLYQASISGLHDGPSAYLFVHLSVGLSVRKVYCCKRLSESGCRWGW